MADSLHLHPLLLMLLMLMMLLLLMLHKAAWLLLVWGKKSAPAYSAAKLRGV
jgi:hypothetical protein